MTLNISHNALASIDVSKLTELKALWIIDCGITQVNISRNTALTKFMAVRNSLTSLDLSKNTSIQTLWLTDNKLKTLDLSNNTNLLHIQIQKNTLTDLDLSANTKLGQVLVSHNPKLNCIGVSRGQTSNGQWVKDTSQSFSVDCSALDSLLYTAIPDANFEQFLINLGLDDVIDGKMLTAKALKVTKLYLGNKSIKSLKGIRAFKNLTYLNVYGNQLTHLDLEGLTVLGEASLSNNQLTTLDVASLVSLKKLYVNNNQLTSLKLPSNRTLTVLKVNDNQLSNLNLSLYTDISNLNVSSNANLSCIQVASPDIADGANAKTGRYTNWNKDDSQNFSVNCN